MARLKEGQPASAEAVDLSVTHLISERLRALEVRLQHELKYRSLLLGRRSREVGPRLSLSRRSAYTSPRGHTTPALAAARSERCHLAVERERLLEEGARRLIHQPDSSRTSSSGIRRPAE